MDVRITANPSLYEETVTTDYATAKLLYEIHKETAVIINERYWFDESRIATVYRVTWRKGR